MSGSFVRATAPYLVCIGLGFGAAWSWQGSRADARVQSIENDRAQERLDQALEWRRKVLEKQALADAIANKAAARDQEYIHKLEETQDALKIATRGRPCLGGTALRVLDRATGLRPPAAAGALHGGSAAAAADPAIDEAEEVATDTDVAGWIAVAGDYYERCRARIRDIRDYGSGG